MMALDSQPLTMAIHAMMTSDAPRLRNLNAKPTSIIVETAAVKSGGSTILFRLELMMAIGVVVRMTVTRERRIDAEQNNGSPRR